MKIGDWGISCLKCSFVLGGQGTMINWHTSPSTIQLIADATYPFPAAPPRIVEFRLPKLGNRMQSAWELGAIPLPLLPPFRTLKPSAGLRPLIAHPSRPLRCWLDPDPVLQRLARWFSAPRWREASGSWPGRQIPNRTQDLSCCHWEYLRQWTWGSWLAGASNGSVAWSCHWTARWCSCWCWCCGCAGPPASRKRRWSRSTDASEVTRPSRIWNGSVWQWLSGDSAAIDDAAAAAGGADESRWSRWNAGSWSSQWSSAAAEAA